MAKTTLIWLMCSTIVTLTNQEPSEYNGICVNMSLRTLEKMKQLENCTIVIGNLKIFLLERTVSEDFKNVSFPKLKEVTGHVIIYRVKGLETLADLLPNLARIRGNTLMYNYALIVYDVLGLREIGLNNLLKIDRGGVIVWGSPLTCFVNTINWNAIAPRSRHILSEPDKYDRCNFLCTCSTNPARNFCWNNRKCQIFLEGPESLNCSCECIGCRKTNPNNCTLCRDYTFKGECISHCPNDTLVLSESNRCVTDDECKHLNYWAWNKSCISECPKNFVISINGGNKTCVSCPNCHHVCKSLTLQTLDTIQRADKCVQVNGSLTIHLWSIPNAANELRYFLKNIAVVTDYIKIYGSIALTSLDFLSSLERIKGQRLLNGKYSLIIYDMDNLQSLFTPNVTQNLIVDRGTIRFYRNPMLCYSLIKTLKLKFPVPPNELDIPQGLNGYSGTCNEIFVNLTISVYSEKLAIATFYSYSNDIQYTVLYVKIPPGMNDTIVPETCSDTEWYAVRVPDTNIKQDNIVVTLRSLRPASTYAVCVEKYEPKSRHLARSAIVKFKTLVGKPEPPFIQELVASSSSTIVIRWVDHVDYRPYIEHYELDINVIDINVDVILARNHCSIIDDEWFDIDYTRHAKVMRPPINYEKGCESMCGILSSVPAGIMVEDHFEVCDVIGECDDYSERPPNSKVKGIVKSLALNISGPRDKYQIGGLAPFRDYKFSLRACTKEQCSRAAKSFVRTLHSEVADVASITFTNVTESGLIYIKWDHPKITNGPLLAYNIEIYPNVELSDMNHVVPHIICVPGNETSLKLKSRKATKYLVRVCSTTLAHAYFCNEWKKIEVVEYGVSWWWSGVLFGLFLCAFSLGIGWRRKNRVRRSDSVPLFDMTSNNRQESEPPAVMLSDFMPSQNISFLELHDYS